MKKAKTRNGNSPPDEMLPEYDLDAMKSRPNRFAGRRDGSRLVITLDPDVSEVFTSAESVNTVLRALIVSMPPAAKKTTA
jgi:hypothetical protein